MKSIQRHEARRRAEQRSLEKKSLRTGLPVSQIRHPKHVAKREKK